MSRTQVVYTALSNTQPSKISQCMPSNTLTTIPHNPRPHYPKNMQLTRNQMGESCVDFGDSCMSFGVELEVGYDMVYDVWYLKMFSHITPLKICYIGDNYEMDLHGLTHVLSSIWWNFLVRTPEQYSGRNKLSPPNKGHFFQSYHSIYYNYLVVKTM